MNGVTVSSLWLLLLLVTLVSASYRSSAAINDVSDQRQRRSLASVPIIGSLFGEKEPAIPHLGNQPLWKVHRYNGITLIPIDLPDDEALAAHPVPPYHTEEAPSIVNVPDPHYAPKDTVPLPPNEYGPPEHSPAAPYPAASAPAGPYPAASVPSGPYPPASAPSGPYPSAHEEHAEPADYNHPHSGVDIDSALGGLAQILPPEIYQKLQQYMSTPEGYERINALVGIATNAKKLKSGAAHSLQEVFQRLFGGAGGSTDIGLQSGTYTNIPKTYPAHQGIFNSFAPIGTGISGSSVLSHLPEVPPLPKVPGLTHLPPTPALPHINLPASGHFAHKGAGQYVSISLPSPPEEAPAPSYGPPAETYGPPDQSYGVPTQSYSPPADTYSPPAQSYSAPTQSYSAPTQSYSAPTQSYSAPTQSYSAPTQSYSPPAPTYQTPAQAYSAPQVPSTSYGTPSGPTYNYQHSFQPSQQVHGFDHTASGSEVQEQQYQPRHKDQEQQEEKETQTETSPVTPETTKLHRVHHLRSDELRKYLDSNRNFRHRFQPKDQTQNQSEENDLPEVKAEE